MRDARLCVDRHMVACTLALHVAMSQRKLTHTRSGVEHLQVTSMANGPSEPIKVVTKKKIGDSFLLGCP
jgi:hypothetical protein